jgi:hypothetical protein
MQTSSEEPADRAALTLRRARVLQLLLLAAFALGIGLRLPTFGRPLLSDDEAIYATTADALARGDLLYRDVVDHKPPLIYYFYQAGFALSGAYDTEAAHAMVVAAVLVVAALLFAMARREGSADSYPTGLAAAALYLVFSTTWHDYDALAANCELFLLAPQTAAAWLLLRGPFKPGAPGPGWARHLGVGILVGTSALFKYQGLTFVLAGCGLLAWSVVLGRLPWWRALVHAALEAAGALLPAALYLAWAWHAGSAAATIYWFEFNFSYVGAGLTGLDALERGVLRTGLVGGVALVPYALGLAAATSTAAGMVRAIRRRARDGRSPAGDEPRPLAVLAALWLFTSAIAVAAGGRFFGHYFHLVLPPLCLLAAPGCVRLWRKGRAARSLLVALCAVPAFTFFALASFARPIAAKIDEREPPYAEVAARIDALTAPNDRVFVWGNSPQLYVLARRPMGARFSFCNYMTGESPGTPTESGVWNADRNQWPAAWNMLFADLEARRPALFVDAAAAGWDGYDKFPIARYPRLLAYVGRHYRPVETSAGVVLYRRLP